MVSEKLNENREREKMLSTCLSAGVVESGRRLDGHGGDGAVADLGARVATSARLGQLLRLGRLATEVAAAHHFLGRRLAPETASDQDLLGRRRLSPAKPSTTKNTLTSSQSIPRKFSTSLEISLRNGKPGCRPDMECSTIINP